VTIEGRDLRVFVYDHIVARGLPPTSREIAQRFRVEQHEALRALRDVNIGKTILPHPQSGEIWMAGPFSASETVYQVNGKTQRWWANCAWDMLGVAVLVGEPVTVETQCFDCNAPLNISVSTGGQLSDNDLVVHFLVPARQWYDDIGFT
jgi:hypothetical protein